MVHFQFRSKLSNSLAFCSGCLLCGMTELKLFVVNLLIVLLSSCNTNTQDSIIARGYPVHLMNAEHLRLPSSFLLSPKADVHFTIPQTVEGCVDLGSKGVLPIPVYHSGHLTNSQTAFAVGFYPRSHLLALIISSLFYHIFHTIVRH